MKKRLFSTFTALLMICSMVMYFPSLTINASAQGTHGYVWPVVGSDSISTYWSTSHYGIDITSWNGADREIIATKSGTIWRKLTGCNNYGGLNSSVGNCTSRKICNPNYGSYDGCFCNYGMGNGYIIHHDDGTWAEYGHMKGSSLPSELKEGTHVSQGQYLGMMGAAGMATGLHLHFNLCSEAYVSNYFSIYHSHSFNPFNVVNGNDIFIDHIHNYTGTVTKQATCTEAGTRKYTCSCGSTYTETIAKLGHDYKTTVVAPTLTDDGYTMYECSRCHDSYKADIVPAPVLKDDGYYYCDAIPKEVTADEYDIEYKNYFEKTQKDSPGAGWTKGAVVKNEWQNSGSQYTTESPLPTSDSRVLVRDFYYHWCIPGAGMTTEGNYEQTSRFAHYDEISLPNEYIHVVGTYDDNGHPFYLLAWSGGQRVYCKSGETCDGSWGTHDYRCQVWYRNYVYQDRVKIELYKWTKESDWTNAKESGATRVSIRFKAKHHAVAVEAKEATCTEDGNIAYWYCPDCNKYYSDSACTDEITQESTVIKATGHNYTVTTTEPACTETGENVYTCEKCGDTYNEEILAKGHNWTAAIYTWSADNKICTAIRVCANDSTHVETESVSTTYSVTKQPTNVEKGTGTYTAIFKNTAFAEQTKNVDIPVTTHQYPVVTSEVQGRQFRLKWTAVEGAEKYGIAVYQSGGWRVKVQVKSNTTSYTSPKMKSGTYKMVVCAKINGNWDTSSLKSRAFNVKIA